MPPAANATPQGPGPLRLFLIVLTTILISTGWQMYQARATLDDVQMFFSREGPIAELYAAVRNADAVPVKLHGSTRSTCTQRVELVLREKGVPYEIITVDLGKGEQKEPSWLDKQPFGQVPVLEDGNFWLFESRAIGRYIAAKYPFRGIPLIPIANVTELALFEQAASIELNDFEPFVSGLMAELVYKKGKGLGEPDQAFADRLRSGLERKMVGYERILSKQRYLAGDRLTVVDLFHLPYGTAVIKKLGIDWHTVHPNVERWWNDIYNRPVWQEIINRS